MIPLLAALLLAGAAGAGPVLVSDACGQDTTNAEGGTTRCAVEKIDRRMKSKDVPAELKVEAEGKLYSVPEGVKYNTPASQASAENWWQEFVRKVREMVDKDSDKDKDGKKAAPSDPPAEGETVGRNSSCRSCDSGEKAASLGKGVRSVGEHSCQICFEHDHSTVMLPCGHGGLCWDCGLQIYALTEECPMCRSKVELLVQVDGDKRRYEGEDEFVSAVCA